MGENTLVALTIVIISLFVGTPDIADAIMYKLTDGKYCVPEICNRTEGK